MLLLLFNAVGFPGFPLMGLCHVIFYSSRSVAPSPANKYSIQFSRVLIKKIQILTVENFVEYHVSHKIAYNFAECFDERQKSSGGGDVEAFTRDSKLYL